MAFRAALVEDATAAEVDVVVDTHLVCLLFDSGWLGWCDG